MEPRTMVGGLQLPLARRSGPEPGVRRLVIVAGRCRRGFRLRRNRPPLPPGDVAAIVTWGLAGAPRNGR